MDWRAKLAQSEAVLISYSFRDRPVNFTPNSAGSPVRGTMEGGRVSTASPPDRDRAAANNGNRKRGIALRIG